MVEQVVKDAICGAHQDVSVLKFIAVVVGHVWLVLAQVVLVPQYPGQTLVLLDLPYLLQVVQLFLSW